MTDPSPFLSFASGKFDPPHQVSSDFVFSKQARGLIFVVLHDPVYYLLISISSFPDRCLSLSVIVVRHNLVIYIRNFELHDLLWETKTCHE